MPAGRPTVMTPEIIARLEEVFLNGASDKEACAFVGIATATLYDYCQANPEFAERKEALKEMPKYRARINIVTALNDGDKQVSLWYAERKIKEEFAQRTETTGKDGKDIIIPIDSKALELAKEYEEKLKEGL